MSAVSGLSVDKRHSRVVLSLLVGPDDPVTGELLRHARAVETLRLVNADTDVLGSGRVEGQVWRTSSRQAGRKTRVRRCA